MRLFLILMLAPLAAVAIDLTDQQRADIEARIQPFSAVCVQGETCGGGSDAVAASAGRSGENVYNAACMACHSAGIAGATWSPTLGAPAIPAEWHAMHAAL